MSAIPASAHRSFATHDNEHPLELRGVVKEFRFISPHALIRLEVKDRDGNSETWTPEGSSPRALVQDGRTSTSLKTGDELQITIDPARSGPPIGAFDVNRATFKNGKPLTGFR